MRELLNPLTTHLNGYIVGKTYLERELDLSEQFGCMAYAWVDIAEHVSLLSAKVDVKKMVGLYRRSLWWRYTPAEVATLQADAGKCQRYVETFRDVLVPRLRAVAACVRTQSHLLSPGLELLEGGDPRGSAILDGVLGMSTKEFCASNCRQFYVQFAGFCDAWEPLVARWEQSDFEMLVSQCRVYT